MVILTIIWLPEFQFLLHETSIARPKNVKSARGARRKKFSLINFS